jgi:hypothetical protein
MCELCGLEKKTQWWHESNEFIVCKCMTCGIPMIVRRQHGVPRDCDCKKDKRMWDAVGKVAESICRDVFGDQFVGFRKEQRKIKDHWHWHVLLRNVSVFDGKQPHYADRSEG